MKKVIIFSIAVLLINGCTKTPEEKIEDLFQNGTEQISEFQYKKADSTFMQILEIDTASVPGLLGISKINDARLEYFDAVENYSMLLSVSTEFEDAFVGLYNAYKNLGFYDEALETAVHYNKNWHANTHTKYILGEAFKNLGIYKRAETYFKQAVNSGYEHKNAAQFMLATVLYQQGFKDDAKKEASQANANQTDDPAFYDAAASYYETVGLIDSAMQYNRKLFEHNNSDMQNVYLSFKRALKNNYLSDARKIIQKLEKLEAPSIVFAGLRLFYALHTEDKSEIRSQGLNYLNLSSGSLTGTMYNLYSLAEVSDKMTIVQNLQMLEVEKSKGKYTDEFGKFYHYAMLMLSVEYSKSPQTIKQLESVSGLRRNRIKYKLQTALTNYVIGLKDECTQKLKSIESAHKGKADWLTGIAEVWANPGVREYYLAEKYYQKAVDADQNYLPAFESYLNLLVRLKKYDKTLKLFDSYPQVEQNNFVALTKTKYLFLNKKYKEGVEQFKKFSQFASGNIVFANELLTILKTDNRQDEINSLLDMLDSNNTDVKLLLASRAYDNNELEKSLKYFTEILDIEPQNAEANIIKADVLYRSGKTTEALELFEKNLVDFKNNPQNFLYYSRVLAEEGADFSRASNMARRAVFEGYGYYKYLINLADIYYMMGRYDLCRGEAIKAYRAQKDNPYPYFRLGMACVNSKDQERWLDEGKEHLAKAIELGLTGDLLKEANKALN